MSMFKDDSARLIKLAREFLGYRVIILMAVSITLGLILFIVELLMAFSIQLFFVELGLIDSSKDQHWLSTFLGSGGSSQQVLLLRLVVGTLRGFITWGQNHASSITTVEFETLSRDRITTYAFGERSAQIARVTNLFNDKTIGAGNFVSSVMGGISRVIVALLLIYTLIGLAPGVTTISLVLLSFLYLPYRFLSRKIRSSSESIHSAIDGAMTRLLMGVKNIFFLHVYGLQDRERKITRKYLSKYLANYRSYHFFSGLKTVLPQVAGIWLVCLITVTANSQGVLKGGQLIEYFYLFIRFVQSVGELTNLGSYISLTRPRFVSVWDWWRSSRKSVDDRTNLDADAEPYTGAVGWEVSRLTFSYSGSEKPVIQNLNLTIPKGNALVVTGASGSGKSTLLAILLGLIKVPGDQVSLRINGAAVSLRDGRPRLLAGLGYVGPESFIIPGTIRDNLLYGTTPSKSDEELCGALELAECEFIFKMRDGLDYVLTEQGEGLSAGQKQRLSLARALLRDPNVLVLDEATANLDAETEESLVDTLSKLKGSVTIIAVTHRKALLKIADQTLELKP